MDNTTQAGKFLPPFYVGQEVVAINSHSKNVFKKNDEFKVTGIFFQCCVWRITIGILSPSEYDNKTYCSECGTPVMGNSNEWPFNAVSFAPITSTFQSISLEKCLELETPLISVN